jgi:ABC-2 type transport system ATP-binding protein
MSIEVNRLTKKYGEQKAVNNISFTVNQGEIAGFLGPNGAGKSTTMKIITGYLQPDEGLAKVCGTNVADDPLGCKKKIGYLPEANPLYYDMYVREYLWFIAGVHQVANKQKAVEEAIAITGLVSESKKKTGQLSKGYKQRVGLAAALVHDPKVLILDEPTSGLDPNQIIEIRDVIKQLGRKKTILFSSHILQEVEAVCDRVIIINKGSLVADDTLANLQKKSGGTTLVILELKEKADTPLMQAAFGNIVQSIDGYTWKFTTNEPEQLKKQILELAIKNNLDIVSLQSDQQSLEEIFRNLTKNNPSEKNTIKI